MGLDGFLPLAAKTLDAEIAKANAIDNGVIFFIWSLLAEVDAGCNLSGGEERILRAGVWNKQWLRRQNPSAFWGGRYLLQAIKKRRHVGNSELEPKAPVERKPSHSDISGGGFGVSSPAKFPGDQEVFSVTNAQHGLKGGRLPTSSWVSLRSYEKRARIEDGKAYPLL